MIREVKIENFKSIHSLKLELGRVNVFIGANGSGKSNILEAIAMGAGAYDRNLGTGSLSSRGIRISDSNTFISGFSDNSDTIKIAFNDREYLLKHGNNEFSKWELLTEMTFDELIKSQVIYDYISGKYEENGDRMSVIFDEKKLNNKENIEYFLEKQNLNSIVEKIKQEHSPDQNSSKIKKQIRRELIDSTLNVLSDFKIYSPENYFLRLFENNNLDYPLGVRGEGLFKLLTVIKNESITQFKEIVDFMSLIDWFEGFDIPDDLQFTESRIQIQDRFLEDGLRYFDQRSANEGFLYLLFYCSLFISEFTPKFFAIENIDNSLNPKLGSELIRQLSRLASKHEKQVLFTTHNPAILDGLNLNDDDQRLFIVARNADGHTKVRRVKKKELDSSETPVRLSEQFLRGYIGGLPKNF